MVDSSRKTSSVAQQRGMAALPRQTGTLGLSSHSNTEIKRTRKNPSLEEALFGDSSKNDTSLEELLDIVKQIQMLDISRLQQACKFRMSDNTGPIQESESNQHRRLGVGVTEDYYKLEQYLMEKDKMIEELQGKQSKWDKSIKEIEIAFQNDNVKLKAILQDKVKELTETKGKLEATEKKLEETKRVNFKTVTSPNSIEQLRRINSELERKLQKTEKELQDAIEKHVQWKESAELTKSNLEEEIIKLKTKLDHQRHREEEIRKKLQDEERKVKSAEIAKSEALTRLSREMGTKLNDNNPAIADLSDPNRATKLAEMYNEIYDNEWTDALEVLEEKYGEEVAIKYLLETLKSVSKFCCKKAKYELEDIEKMVFKQIHDDQTSTTNKKMIMKMLKDDRKSEAESKIEQIYNEYVKVYDRNSMSYYVPEYVKKVVKLCWLMNVQDPPVCLGDEASTYESLDSNIYKAYTNTGTSVLYTVWLPLYLHKGGPLLAKGVAQPMRQKNTAVTKRSVQTKNREIDRGHIETKTSQSRDRFDPTDRFDAANWLANYNKQAALDTKPPTKLAWDDKSSVNLTHQRYEYSNPTQTGNYEQTSSRVHNKDHEQNRYRLLDTQVGHQNDTAGYQPNTQWRDFTATQHKPYYQSSIPTHHYTSTKYGQYMGGHK